MRLAGLDRASDDEIWRYAEAKGFCIVSQNSDFSERSRLYGAPPKVVWLRCGNATPRQIEVILRHNAILISELIQNPDLHCVELL